MSITWLIRRLSLIGTGAIWLLKFVGVFYEDHSKLSTFYWSITFQEIPYLSRFIANSCSCTTTELSIPLTTCFTSIRNHAIKYNETGKMVKIYFGPFKIQGRFTKVNRNYNI